MDFHCCVENNQKDNGFFPFQLCNNKLESEIFPSFEALGATEKNIFKSNL